MNEEINNGIFTQQTVSYKAPYVITVFLVALLVVALDVFFVGIGLTMAIFKSFRWATILIFIIKILADVAIFATWFLLVKEKADRLRVATFTCTKTTFEIEWDNDLEQTKVVLNRDQVSVKIKQDFLRKFYGVYTVVFFKNGQKFACNFYSETKERLVEVLKTDK